MDVEVSEDPPCVSAPVCIWRKAYLVNTQPFIPILCGAAWLPIFVVSHGSLVVPTDTDQSHESNDGGLRLDTRAFGFLRSILSAWRMSKKLVIKCSEILGKQTWELKFSLTPRSQGKLEVNPRKHRAAVARIGVNGKHGVNGGEVRGFPLPA